MSLLEDVRSITHTGGTIPRIEGISFSLFFFFFFPIFPHLCEIPLSMDSVMRIREIGEVCTKVFQLEIIPRIIYEMK